jgi:L-alanine-DL-glutamate epimerase-like enolase superfamily enzyme
MPAHPTDVRPIGATLYLLPVETRVPLKFGAETLTRIVCARVRMRVRDRQGRTAQGWGETPLSVQWVWPGSLSYGLRLRAMIAMCRRLAQAWARFDTFGHPLEVGIDFQREALADARRQTSDELRPPDPLPHLAALVCCSPFDIALHDAYGNLIGKSVYETYTRQYMSRDLAAFLQSDDPAVDFSGHFPCDYLVRPAPSTLRAWHLVGGLDPLEESELRGDEPDDGYPVMLTDWIRTDGLKCLKIKLRGSDGAWDYDRLVRVGRIAASEGVEWLTADFNCTVRQPQYVNDILDRLRRDHPRTFERLLYVEQPFAYDLEANPIDVRSVASRKPLFMDESAHDWRLIRLGRSLGWTGVALKTCKTQSGAVLSLCWARAHGMALMVQDLTNPMLAQIPHVLLGAHAGTIMGVETNAMQFYPDASAPEAMVHPGLYRRRGGCVDLSSIRGSGMGYRLDEIRRQLPPPQIAC